MCGEFQGRTAIVTGAGSNLGRAIALQFAASGARVIAVDRDGGRAAETCALSKSPDAISIAADVRFEAEVVDFVSTVRRTHASVDILVNCAGITQTGRPHLAEVGEDLFEQIMAVNFKGIFLTMKHVLPPMVGKSAGCIVNVASAAGLVGEPGMAVYSASKHAVIGLTRSAALEYGPRGVRINAICPSRQASLMLGSPKGTISAEQTRQLDQAMNPASGRAGAPEELAATVLFLCSSGAANIHGAAILADGGFTAM